MSSRLNGTLVIFLCFLFATDKFKKKLKLFMEKRTIENHVMQTLKRR